MKNQTIALLGATGKAGNYILKTMLAEGYHVKALIRNNDYAFTHPSLEVVHGDATDAVIIKTLIGGCDAVVSAIGPRKEEPLCSSLSTTHILSAISEHSISRYICLAGLNVDVPGDNKSKENIAKSDWMRQNFPQAVADRQKAYQILTESDADWTFVRLPWIEETVEKRGVLTNLYDCPGERISTTDIAEFVIGQINSNTFSRQAPFVASR